MNLADRTPLNVLIIVAGILAALIICGNIITTVVDTIVDAVKPTPCQSTVPGDGGSRKSEK